MYTYPIRSDELYHHGVKGMHWGVRRYQNYDGTLKHPKGNDDGDKKRFKLSDKQKRAIMTGIAVAGAGLAVYGLYKTGKLDDIARVVRNSASKNVVSVNKSVKVKDIPKQNVTKQTKDDGAGSAGDLLNGADKVFSKHTPDVQNDFKHINPGRNGKLNGVDSILLAKDGSDITTVNCQSCTAAYEMTRRGLNCQARPIDTRELPNQYVMDVMYKTNGRKFTQANSSSIQQLEAELDWPNGSRGNLIVNGPCGPHSVAIEIVNGRLGVFDTQNSMAFSTSNPFINNTFRPLSFMRTDDLELNDSEKILEIVAPKTK